MNNNFIKRMKIRNILSFDDEGVDIELKPLNVLIGANASGKSNFLTALKFLFNLSDRSELLRLLSKKGGIDNFICKIGNKNQNGFLESVLNLSKNDNDLNTINYSIKFQENQKRLMIIEEILQSKSNESITNDIHRKDSTVSHFIEDPRDITEPIDKMQNEESLLGRILEEYPKKKELKSLYKILHENLSFVFFDFFDPKRLKEPNKAGEFSNKLYSDCSNLHLLLNRMDRDKDYLSSILGKLKEVYEDISELRVFPELQLMSVYFKEESFEGRLPTENMSDGLIKFIGLLTALNQPDPPPVICIEEPEIGLHPDAIASLADCLTEASQRTQLIITTHSPLLVDCLYDRPDSIIVCEKDDKRTQMKRLNTEEIKDWMEDYSLGDLWLRGGIGGTRY